MEQSFQARTSLLGGLSGCGEGRHLAGPHMLGAPRDRATLLGGPRTLLAPASLYTRSWVPSCWGLNCVPSKDTLKS